MRRTKANRALTFVMAAALLIGSIHGVGAKEQSKAYDAPELTLLQGESDYDLTAGITYDSEKYTLSVTDTGDFDINVVGDYEISYTLAGKENSVEETESVENTESTEKIETTETVSDTETVDATEVVEDTEQNPEGGSQTDGKDGTDGADVSQPENGNQTDGVTSAEENPDAGKNVETDSDIDSSTAVQSDVTIEEEQTPKADTFEKSGSKQKTINFKRIVHVVATEVTAAEDEIAAMFLDEARKVNSSTINLGNAVYNDDNTFSFPDAVIKGKDSQVYSMLSVNVTDGSIDITDATFTDNADKNGKHAFGSWVLNNQNNAKEKVEQKIRSLKFTYQKGMQVDIEIDANASNEKFKNIDSKNVNLTYFGGHYYMYLTEKTTWSNAYNVARSYVMCGRRGYLATVTSTDEIERLFKAGKGSGWVGGTMLRKTDDTLIDGNSDLSRTIGVLQIPSNVPKDENESAINQRKALYYWADGPEAKTLINVVLWNGQEPNYADRQNSGYLVDNIMGVSNVGDPESCTLILLDVPALNNVHEGNWTNGDGYDFARISRGYYIEFGGYDEGQDPGGRDESLCETTTVTVNNVYDAEVKIIDSQNNEVKYGPLADALDVAQAGEIVEIIKDTVTPATDAILKKDVQLKSNGRTYVYTGDTDTSKIDVAADGKVTLTDGRIKASDNTTLNVKSPVDNNTYQITTPSGASHVWVPKGSGDETPCVYNEKTSGTSDLTIGDVKYTFSNKSMDDLTLVYIPDAMYKNEMVTKAEVPADKNGTIKLDDGDRNTITVKGGGSASDTVTVERRASEKQKADVKLPANVTAGVFGHEIGTVPASGVTVSHAFAGNVKYPNRDYVTIKTVGEQITIDGVTYTADDADQKFYLGTFNVNITTGTEAEISGGKPADPHYLESYTVKITPKAGYDIDKDNVTVTMKKTDRASDGENVWSVAKHNFDEVCTEEADGSITVKLDGDRVVTGDITIDTATKRQMTTIRVTGLTDNGAKGTYKAVQSGNEYTPNKDGEITVNRNEEVTITFTPDDFDNSYYSELTGEKGESFSILTGLTETTNGDKNLFDQTMKDSFNWTEKSYELKYTPTTADTELKAAFTSSHIVHIHVTGGTAEVTGANLLKKETAGAQQFQHVIVADNGTVPVTITDTTGHNPVVKTAYWSDVSKTPAAAGTNVTNNLTGAGNTYSYTTPVVTKPQALNVTFEEGQTVEVTVTNGTLDQAGRTWKDKGNNTFQTIVTNNGTLDLKVKPQTGYGLKSITVNGTPVDIAQAVKYNLLTYDAAEGVYTHTTQKIFQAWKVVVDFEKQHEVIFKNQNGEIINKSERITVVDGNTLPQATFTKMQKETDKLKADNETFFVWVDKDNNDKVYNASTVFNQSTADQVTLTPVYRTSVTPGADGSTIAADDFIIHVDDVKNLTAEQAKTFADVKAYDKDGHDITDTVTVDQTKLEELKKQGKGTYTAALTFTAGAAGAAISVNVEVVDDNPAIIGKTAHTLTFVGRPSTTYNVQKLDAGNNPTGNVLTFKTDAEGKATATGLDKATTYKVSHKSYGSAVGKTSLVDAKDIAKQFEDKGADDTTGNNAQDETEKAENSNVDVVVNDNGSYKVIVKKDIDHTVEIPDTWENVKIDLDGNTITGDKGTDTDNARPGLDFVKDPTINEHPGTNLEIVNGTIKGGDGSEEHPDGAPGIGTAETPDNPASAGVTVGKDAYIIGGNGADAKNEGENGGNGGSGIDGEITPVISGGTVTGGNGGRGSDSSAGKPGNGGNGGAGITTDDKKVTVIEGTVSGGDAGNGGNATGDNKNEGGSGGNGGSGIDSGKGDIILGPGKTDVNGGNGGNGGDSSQGNGGNGGSGGT